MTRLDRNDYDHAGFRLHRRGLGDWAIYFHGHLLADHLHFRYTAALVADRLAPYRDRLSH